MYNSITKIPEDLLDKPKEAKDAFLTVANASKSKGMTLSQSISDGRKAALDVISKMQAKPVIQKQVSLAESIKSKSTFFIYEDEEEDSEEIEKAVDSTDSLVSNKVRSVEFDAQGKLVIFLEDGSRVISKNAVPLSNIYQNNTIAVNPVFDYLLFNTQAHLNDESRYPGMLTWNEFEDCLDIVQADGSTYQAGLEGYIQVKNNTEGTLDNGTVVMFAGVDLDEIPTVMPIAATPEQEPLYIVGVLTNAIASGSTGRATIVGKVRSLDTTGTGVGESWNMGDLLWVHPSLPGKFTNVRPTAPHPVISVAAVLKVSSTEGIVLVRPTIFPRLFYGRFYSTQTQTPALVNTPYAVTLNNTQISSGISIQNSSHIVCQNAGLYSFDFRLQVTSTNSSQKNIYIWARKNGTDIPYSNTKLTLVGNAVEQAPAWGFVVSMEAGEYFQLMYAVDDPAISISAPAPTAFAPATPSVLMKVTQVNL